MSSNKEDTLRQFCEVTGADEARSRFYLDSSNWQLEVALSSFYEHGGNIDELPSNPTATAAAVPTLSDSDMESPPQSPVRPKKDKKKRPGNQKFATLDSMRQDSSSEEEEGQAFYAGGSERSGQQIIGPGKGPKDIVNEMFKSVKERGATVFEDEPSSGGRGRGGAAFSGAGYRLGQTADDHEQVNPSRTQSQQDQPRSVRLRLYREGFTVDSGPLRPYTDPENAEFLNYIRRGEIPPSLARSGDVRVSMEDRRLEECPRPSAAKPQAFSGKGQMLGSPTPPTVGATAPVASDASDRAANQRAAQAAVGVDDSKPVTTIQFRLADGSRLTGRFNESHTVADLREYVARAEPSYQLQSFTLLTAFPSRELEDLAETIADARLQNSTLMPRVK